MSLRNLLHKSCPVIQIALVCVSVYLIIHGILVLKEHEKREEFSALMKWTLAECDKAGMKSTVLPAYERDTLIAVCIPQKPN
jgi:hypothetical protein